MRRKNILKYTVSCCITVSFTACLPVLVHKEANKNTPAAYNNSPQDTANTAKVNYQKFFTDPLLVSLIDTALKNNQELNIVTQEINIAKNTVKAKKGAYLPFLSIGAAAGVTKSGKYTMEGAAEDAVQIVNGQNTPSALPDYLLAGMVSWQVDIWKQLRNAKKSANYKYLSSIEGRNFMVTNLVAEIAYNYYELMALDNQLIILKQNIEIQENALKIVTLEKMAGQVTELAVLRFQAEVTKNKSRLYYIQQKITQTQNMINFLIGRFPKETERNSGKFNELKPDSMHTGIPSQLLENRPDVRQAELDLLAAKLDIKVAKANFYPVFNITAGLGYNAFQPKYFLNTPESMIYNFAGSLVAPVVNRNAIKAEYMSANARQVQAAFNFERTILNAYTEVANQQANIMNLSESYSYKSQQVEALSKSVNAAINLFKSGRADYVEILLTQRDAIESKMDLIEIKKQQLNASVKMYQVLGGGWR